MNADLGGYPSDQQVGDSTLSQPALQAGRMECPLSRLHDAVFASRRLQPCDKVGTRFAIDKNPTHWSRITDAHTRYATITLRSRTVRQIASMRFACMHNGQAGLTRTGEQLGHTGYDGRQLGDIIAQTRSEAPRLNKVSLHIDDHQRGSFGRETIGKRPRIHFESSHWS
ncbi:hypothetical protein BA898_05650 [Spiribacter roseus]|nr:hypothetical protein BA898_05650 [Spiribacter roseus]